MPVKEWNIGIREYWIIGFSNAWNFSDLFPNAWKKGSILFPEVGKRMFKKTVKKGIWLSGGIIFLLLALIGLLLPVIPQVPFFLVAVLCFVRCSPRLNKWVGRQHWFQTFHTWAEQKHWFKYIKEHLPKPGRKNHHSS
jgi:hypothetical protein